MINNLFEKAIQNKQCNEFFKGVGEYFVRNRETGEHSHNTQMSGSVVNFVNNDEHRMQIFSDVLKQFIHDADPENFESISSVLINISAYWIAKNRGLFPESNMLCSLNDPTFKEFNSLLDKLRNQPFTVQEKEVLENYCTFLYKYDAQILANMLAGKLLNK